MTLRAACRLSPASFRWTTAASKLGTESRKRRNRSLKATSFLSKLCHYVLNVHGHPFVNCVIQVEILSDW